jgi:hypothetical protein
MEALRVVCRVEKGLFREIIQFAREHFEADRASYLISSGLDLVPEAGKLGDDDLERVYLDQDHGRQILHVTYGSVLTQKTDQGAYLFRDRIVTLLRKNEQLHEEVLRNHLGKHVRLLLVS